MPLHVFKWISYYPVQCVLLGCWNVTARHYTDWRTTSDFSTVDFTKDINQHTLWRVELSEKVENSNNGFPSSKCRTVIIYYCGCKTVAYSSWHTEWPWKTRLSGRVHCSCGWHLQYRPAYCFVLSQDESCLQAIDTALLVTWRLTVVLEGTSPIFNRIVW